jgi:hypothetical protein
LRRSRFLFQSTLARLSVDHDLDTKSLSGHTLIPRPAQARLISGLQVTELKRIFASPTTFLLLLAALLYVKFCMDAPVWPWVMADSLSYLHFNMDSFTEALQQGRTIGYPLFLRFYKLFSPELLLIGHFQTLVFFGSVFFFYAALRVYGIEKWMAFASAFPMLFSALLHRVANSVMCDVVGAAAAIVTCGLVFMATGAPRIWPRWACVGASLFVTYQIRPSYIYLAALIPLLVLFLAAHRANIRLQKGCVRKHVIVAAIMCIVPFLAFSTLRLVLTGNFGVVSFGGYMLAGVTSQFLDREVAQNLDEDLQPLAAAIMAERDRLQLGVGQGRKHLPMDQLVKTITALQWEVFAPAALKWAGKSGSMQAAASNLELQYYRIELNQVGARLGLAIIMQRPVRYVFYCAKAFFYSVAQTFVVEPSLTVLLVLLFLTHVIVMGYRIAFPQLGQGNQSRDGLFNDVNALLVFSVFFSFSQLTLLVLVVPPDPRYLQAAGVFLPGALAAACHARILSAIRPNPAD